MKKKRLLLLNWVIALALLVSFPSHAFAECYGAYNEVSSFLSVSQGSSGNTVRVVQTFLRTYSWGWAETIDSAGGVDGSFGQTTKQRVCDFQSARGISPTGVVNSDTWSEINSLVYEDTMVYPSPDNLTHQGSIRTNAGCYLAFQLVWRYRHLSAESQINFYCSGGILPSNWFHYCLANAADFDPGYG